MNKISLEKAGEYLYYGDTELPTLEEQVDLIIAQSKIDNQLMIDWIDEVTVVEAFENRLSCEDFLDMIYDKYANLKIARDESSLDIYIDNGEDKEPTHVCYWNEDEWLEDAETVVPAMLTAMELFYTNPDLLLTKLGIEI